MDCRKMSRAVFFSPCPHRVTAVDQVEAPGDLAQGEGRGRRGQDGRKSEYGKQGVPDVAQAEAQRGGQGCRAPLGHAPGQNVDDVRPWREDEYE